MLRFSTDFSDLESFANFDNLGAIVDLHISAQGKHTEAILCSGINSDSSIKIVRKGITPRLDATLRLEHLLEVFTLKADSSGEYYSLLVLSFPGCTRILELVGVEFI